MVAVVAALLAALSGGAAVAGAEPADAAGSATTAWQHGAFNLDPLAVVSRDDIVMTKADTNPNTSLPLGNGALGVAAWAAGGFTAQLNRSDTMPSRKSPGQLTIPGLSAMTQAADFTGRLDLTSGMLEESGGGISMKAWVSTATDELIVDVSGANPDVAQTASVSLWSGRHPAAAASGTTGTLAETWQDNSGYGASGQTFGTLAAITANGRNVRAGVAGSTKVQLTFTPDAKGDFRVVVAAPHWAGGDAAATAAQVIGNDATLPEAALLGKQNAWWHQFWTHSGVVEMNSADGSAAYIENLRTLYLYDAAASSKAGTYFGSQAGEADMFAWSQDKQTWAPNDYWLWNLRGEISANMSSGNYQLNTPIFDMYINDLPAIETWTKEQMGGLPGACVPETMSFNGNGYYGDGPVASDASCALAAAPQWNALNVSSGAEVSLYMWQQYQGTKDIQFLRRAFPFMEATAQFLLAYQEVGSDGLLHAVANAHETQWSVQDPTTDIVADQTIFPIVAQAAKIVGDTPAADPLLGQFATALTQIPPYPRTDTTTKSQLLNPDYSQSATQAADATGTDMIGISYQPAAQRHNGENVELEPLWPWNQVSDQDANLFSLEQRGYASRPNKGGNDWSYDALDAARLQQPAQVEANLVSITEAHQVYVNGLADINNSIGYQPYQEQSANVAAAVDEALAQDYDGIIRFAPAWPSDWDGSGSVAIQHKDRVDVQVESGRLVTAAVEAATTESLRVKNPWPGRQVQVVDGSTGQTVVAPTSAALLTLNAQAGSSYLVEPTDAPTTALPYAPVTGTPATTDKRLGTRHIGLDDTPTPPPCATPTASLLAAYDPTSGSTVTDVSGNRRDLSFAHESAAYASDGPTGTAAVVGSGGYLTSAATSMGFVPDATFAVEVKAEPSPSYRRIWDWKSGSGGDGDGLLLDLTPSNALRLITTGTNHSFATQLPMDAWENLVVTVADTGDVTVYLNGRQVEQTTLGETDPPGINGCATGAVHLGADQGGGQALTGEFDRAAVFTRVLTSAEVADWQHEAGLS
ncbi:LamG domain-containing protein [Actinacidiphila acidipaludis]|uniref:LamG domain-containing protein n=1 Tax=Actinacidiphila acidipaludis TaxID=2873382 RepID=A0ABS7QD22_9ACTN|nr:LamG domain-containing protein [Streptomyces acidipaludis]MBY8880305.1 LamG domain-containing protein [Streptomyces acidipaludis]